ncbi:MAG: helix-turn-helix domain-containing protein, partial [Clostridium sp.]
MAFQIIDCKGNMHYPALLYSLEKRVEFLEVDAALEYIKNSNIYVISSIYNKYGEFLKDFEGDLKREEILSLVYIEREDINLEEILTLSEAAKKWGLSDGSTIRKAIERGKFKPNEIKQAGAVWVTTYKSMTRVFGEEKNRSYTVNYKEFILFLRLLFYKDNQNKRTMEIVAVGNKDNKINLTLESKLNKRTMEEEKKLNDYIVQFLEVLSEGK